MFGLGRAPCEILSETLLSNRIDSVRSAHRVGSFQGDADHAGLRLSFGNDQSILQREDSGLNRTCLQCELIAGRCGQLVDQKMHRAVAERHDQLLADRSFSERFTIGCNQLEVRTLSRLYDELATDCSTRNI